MTTKAANPREVFHQLCQGISAGQWHRLAELYAEDTVVVLPMAPAPVRLAGRAAVAAHFRNAAGTPLELRVENVVIHETVDPEVIVAEFDYAGRIVPDGRTFRVANIQVLRVRDGQIVNSRDYHDHRAIGAAASGGVPTSS